MRIKCPHCNGKGFSEINSALNLTCGWCMGEGELDLEIIPIEPQTNDDIDGKEPMRDWGVCKDCALKENCAEYKPYKRQCEDYERYKEVLTNEEQLKSANTEQLAEFISKIDMPFMDKAPFPCGDLIECNKNCGLYSRCVKDDFPTNKEVWVEWLKQPHKPFS